MPRHPSRSGQPWALLLVCLTCTETPDSADALLVFDSSGVRIQEIQRPIPFDEAGWTVSSEPFLQIGVVEGDDPYELFEVASARMLSDRSVAVLDGGSNQVRLFDSDGTFVRAMGGRGGGPGEFQGPLWIQILPGDTILVLDWALLRVTAFTPMGELAWTETTNDLQTFGSEEIPTDVRLPDGTMIVYLDSGDLTDEILRGRLAEGETGRNTAMLVRRRERRELDTLVMFPGLEEGRLTRGSSRPAAIYPMLGHRTFHVLSSDRVYVGTQESYSIDEYSLAGALVGVIRMPGFDVTITEEDIEAYEAPILRLSQDDPDRLRANLEYLEMVPRANTRPAYGRLVLDSDGHLWISEWLHPLAEPVSWSVFVPEVGLLADVRLPENFRVYEIGSDYVLGKWRDSTGVEYIRAYSLHKR